MADLDDPSEWEQKPWEGGSNPAPGWKVLVVRRDGQERRGLSGLYAWDHTGEASDIVAYTKLPYKVD